MSVNQLPEFIGLEIASDEIRWVRLRLASAPYEVQQWGVIPLPLGLIVEGVIKEPLRLRTIMQQWAQDHSVLGAPVALALPMQNMLSRRIQLPGHQSVHECEQDIQSQLTRYFPGVRDPLQMDFHYLGSAPGGLRDAVVFATRREQMERYVEQVTQVGLELAIVDVDVYALMRAALFGVSQSIGPWVAVLCVGQMHTQFSISHNGFVVFHQVWPGVSAHFIEAQLKRAVFHCLSIHKSWSLSHLIVVGRVPLSDIFFQNEWGWQLQVSDLFAQLHLVGGVKLPSDIAPRLFTASGLALRGLTYARN